MSRTLKVQGFSLLELLIAITIMGFILTLLFSGFSLASRSWDQAEHYIDENSQIQTGLRFIRRLVTQAYPHRWKNTTTQSIAFAGTQNNLQFVAELPTHLGGGLQQIFLDVEEEEGKSRLILRYLPLDRSAPEFEKTIATKPYVVVSDAQKITFMYFGQESTNTGVLADTPPSWVTQWDNPVVLPAMIRIRVEFTQQAADLLITPMITLPNGCRWDETFRLCLPS